MSQLFNQPQRQSIAGIIIFFGYNLQKFLRNLWIPILYILFKKNDQTIEVLIGIFIISLIIAIYSYLDYWFFTFWINEETNEFILKKGIINKRHLVIPIDKIQNINLSQNFLHKIAKVYKISIESAGSSSQEVAISALTLSLANELKLVLNQKVKTNQLDIDQTEEPKERSFKISNQTLLKIGLTSRYKESIALFLFAIIYLGQQLEELIDNEFLEKKQFEQAYSFIDDTSFFIFLIPVVFIILLLINVIRTFLKFYNYTFNFKDNVLYFKYGLIKTNELILKPYKIQKIVTSQNWFQKKLGIFNVVIHQLQDNEVNAEKIKEKLQIPGLTQQELNVFNQYVYQQKPEFDSVLLPNRKRFLVSLFWFLLMPISIFILLKYLNVIEIPSLLGVFYALIVGLLIYVDFKNYKLFYQDNFIKKQSGIWDISQEVIEIHKIQGIALDQYFWQKKSNIGSVSIFTSGNNLYFNTTSYNDLVKLTNIWLFKIEISKLKWI